MDSKRSIGIVLIVIGVTVAVHTIVEPLYHVSSEAHPYSPLWTLLDPLMGLAIVLGLIVLSPYATRRQRRAGRARDLGTAGSQYPVLRLSGRGYPLLLELVQHHVGQRRLRPRQERERERCGLDNYRYAAAAVFGRNGCVPSP